MKFISLIDTYYDKYGLSESEIREFRDQVSKKLRENEKELVSLENKAKLLKHLENLESMKSFNQTLNNYRNISKMYKKVISLAPDVSTYAKNKKEIFKIRREIMDINLSKAFNLPRPG